MLFTPPPDERELMFWLGCLIGSFATCFLAGLGMMLAAIASRG